MQVILKLDEATEDAKYLRACARIRKISPTALCKRVMHMVMKEQLVLSVLDDAKIEPLPRRGEHQYSVLREYTSLKNMFADR